MPSTPRLAAWQYSGFRLIVPDHAEWPTQPDELGDARLVVLWLHGTADLGLTCVNSVAIVGARAATGCGQHVAIEEAATLTERVAARRRLVPSPCSRLGYPVVVVG